MTDVQITEHRTLKRSRVEDAHVASASRPRTDFVNGSRDDEAALASSPGEAQARELQSRLISMDVQLSQQMIRMQREHELSKVESYKQRSGLLAQIPLFWQTALNNAGLRSYMSDEDRSLLQALTELYVTPPDEQGSFAIQLTFADNPYFAPTTLVRTITKNMESEETDVSCSPVPWKQGQDLTQLQDESGNPVISTFPFLSWFLSEGTYAQGDDDLSEQIRCQIWPNPIQYYDGQVDDVDVAVEYVDGDDVEVNYEQWSRDQDGNPVIISGVADDDEDEDSEHPYGGHGMAATAVFDDGDDEDDDEDDDDHHTELEGHTGEEDDDEQDDEDDDDGDAL